VAAPWSDELEGGAMRDRRRENIPQRPERGRKRARATQIETKREQEQQKETKRDEDSARVKTAQKREKFRLGFF
jgi:hypothetical protein